MNYAVKIICALYCFMLIGKESILDQITAYAAAHPEFPRADDNDWYDPVYNAFEEKTSDRLFPFIKHYIQSWIHPEKFLLINFEHQLLDTQKILQTQCSPSSSCLLTKLLTDKSEIIVFGDLYGSFHFLVRCIHFFYEKKIIDADLKIIDPHYSIVFLGNIISRSAYSLETLFLVSLIIQKNPERVWYLQGEQETDSHWQSFGTTRQIMRQISYLISHYVKIQQEIDTFFTFLPKAIFFKLPFNQTLGFMYDYHKDLVKQYRKSDSSNPLVIVQGKASERLFTHEKGLDILPKENSIFRWKVFSVFNELYKRYDTRNSGSFAQISIGASASKTYISEYSDKNGNFEEKSKQLLLTGELPNATAVQGEKKLITLGSSLDLEKQLAPLGLDVKDGIEASILDYNKNPKNNRYFLESFLLNDDYQPAKAHANGYALLDKYHINYMICPVGDTTLQTYYKEYLEKKIPILFPVAGSSLFRNAQLTNIINFRPSFADEIDALMSYVIKRYAVSRFAFFYQDDLHGRAILQSAHEFLKKQNITEWLDVPYASNTTDFKKQIDAIINYQPDAIGLFSVAAETEAFLRQIDVSYIFSKQFFGISLLATQPVRKIFDSLGLSYVFSKAVPHPVYNNLEIVKDFRTFAHEHHIPLRSYALEGYIAMQLFYDALSKIPGIATPEQVMKIFEDYKNFKFKGLTLTFNPQTRSLSQPVWLHVKDHKDWILYEPGKADKLTE